MGKARPSSPSQKGRNQGNNHTYSPPLCVLRLKIPIEKATSMWLPRRYNDLVRKLTPAEVGLSSRYNVAER